MSKRKHLHRYEWLSFSENEQALLENYLASMQATKCRKLPASTFALNIKARLPDCARCMLIDAITSVIYAGNSNLVMSMSPEPAAGSTA